MPTGRAGHDCERKGEIRERRAHAYWSHSTSRMAGRSRCQSRRSTPLCWARPPVLQLIDRLHAAVPDRDLTDLPTDMAENYKHYLYGHPKNGDR